MLNYLNLLIFWKRSLLALIIIPLLFIGFIYISFGELFDAIIIRQNIATSFFQLNTQLNIFENNLTPIPLKTLPQVVSSIGYYSIIFIYILFMIWLILNAISSYIKLSNKLDLKYIMLLEVIGIFAIFIFIVNPGLNVFLSIFCFLIIALVLLMILIYWWYDVKYKQ